MIIFLIKLYLAFVVIDTALVILYRYLLKRELESKEIDEIIKDQVNIEDKLRDDVRSTGKTQEEVEGIIDFVYNNSTIKYSYVYWFNEKHFRSNGELI